MGSSSLDIVHDCMTRKFAIMLELLEEPSRTVNGIFKPQTGTGHMWLDRLGAELSSLVSLRLYSVQTTPSTQHSPHHGQYRLRRRGRRGCRGTSQSPLPFLILTSQGDLGHTDLQEDLEFHPSSEPSIRPQALSYTNQLNKTSKMTSAAPKRSRTRPPS